MGCCGASKYDFDLENSKNISDLINVMKKKSKNLMKEREEIKEHLEDPSKEVTLSKIDDLNDEDLRMRIPYLEKLHDAYEDVIQTMERVELPFNETREHLYNIIENYLISYDLSQKYRNDVANFKQFAFKNERLQTEEYKHYTQ
jgi:hypothetical protein